ncbi:MAG: hypothetical protein M3297_10205, partial [Thermoproteota archaeon]|nr:hypothetical protein [Thermoproteota archaeon]
FSTLQLSLTHHVAGISLMEVMKSVSPVLLISSGGGVIANIIVDRLLAISDLWIEPIVTIFLFICIYGIIACLILRPQYQMLLTAIRAYRKPGEVY